MPDVRLHDDVANRQVQVRLHFHDGDGGWALANVFPYGSDAGAALRAAQRSAEEASRRLRIPWNREAGTRGAASDGAAGGT